MKCLIIETNEHNNNVRDVLAFKSKAKAIEWLKFFQKTSASKLYSQAKFNAKNQSLICHHADNDNVTTFTIKSRIKTK